jgi:hypothetical protein
VRFFSFPHSGPLVTAAHAELLSTDSCVPRWRLFHTNQLLVFSSQADFQLNWQLNSPNQPATSRHFTKPKCCQLQHLTRCKSKSYCDWRSVSLSVSQSVSQSVSLMTRYLLLFDSYGLVFLGRPLWREDGSVLCQSHNSLIETVLLVLSRHGPHRKHRSNIALVSFAAETCLPNRCLEMSCITASFSCYLRYLGTEAVYSHCLATAPYATIRKKTYSVGLLDIRTFKPWNVVVLITSDHGQSPK